MLDRIESAKNVKVLLNSEVTAIEGDSTLRAITITNRQTAEQTVHATGWLFVCIGGAPHTAWAAEVGLVRDEGGYLVTGPDLLHGNQPPPGWPLERSPYYLETNMPGSSPQATCGTVL